VHFIEVICLLYGHCTCALYLSDLFVVGELHVDQRNWTAGDVDGHESADALRSRASNATEGCRRQAAGPQLGCRRSNPEW
jgi:hypothetical protein